MRSLAMCALALVGACNAELADPSTIDNTIDGSNDAAPIDAAVIDTPPDARLCEGGDAHASDPGTGSCFVYFATPKTYADAKVSCTGINASLAVIKSAATNTIVLGLVGTTNALINASDLAVEGTFVWSENAADPLSAGYTNWRLGEPNNGGVNGATENCAVIEGARMGTWDDKPCVGLTGMYAYVCQF